MSLACGKFEVQILIKVAVTFLCGSSSSLSTISSSKADNQQGYGDFSCCCSEHGGGCHLLRSGSLQTQIAMFVIFISVLGLLSSSVSCRESEVLASKLMQTLRLGIKMATTITNPKGSQLVSSVLDKLGNGRGRFEKDSSWNGRKELLPVLLRLIGIDSSKIGDYAFGGMMFLSYLISQLLTTNDRNNRKERTQEEFSPFRFIMNQPLVSGLLTQMKDPNLVELILKEGSERLKAYPAEDVDCIRVLICKISPFVRGMQRSLKFFTRREEMKDRGQEVRKRGMRNVTDFCKRNTVSLGDGGEGRCEEDEEEVNLWEKSNLEDRMYFFVPTLEEVVQYGDECDERFPSCVY